jgi:hypothetical protein
MFGKRPRGSETGVPTLCKERKGWATRPLDCALMHNSTGSKAPRLESGRFSLGVVPRNYNLSMHAATMKQRILAAALLSAALGLGVATAIAFYGERQALPTTHQPKVETRSMPVVRVTERWELGETKTCDIKEDRRQNVDPQQPTRLYCDDYPGQLNYLQRMNSGTNSGFCDKRENTKSSFCEELRELARRLLLLTSNPNDTTYSVTFHGMGKLRNEPNEKIFDDGRGSGFIWTTTWTCNRTTDGFDCE